MMTKTKNQVFLTVDQVAEMQNRSTKSVRRDINAGKIPHYRFGKSVRIGDADLEEFNESRKST
jgi:excisionase family DNA binding protein